MKYGSGDSDCRMMTHHSDCSMHAVNVEMIQNLHVGHSDCLLILEIHHFRSTARAAQLLEDEGLRYDPGTPYSLES